MEYFNVIKMKNNLYIFLRRIVKLPRPNEVWGGKIENKWTLANFYLYLKYCISYALSHVGLIFGVAGTVISFSTWLAVKGYQNINVPLMLFFGILLIAIGGHILITLGMVKRENNLTQSQNEEILEIRNNTRKILETINKR